MKISKFSIFIVHMFDNIIQLRRDYPTIHIPETYMVQWLST